MTQRVQVVLLNLLAVALFLFAAAPARAEAPALKPGDIITIAGQNIYDNGPATQARLASLFGSGMAKDAAGNIYFSDSGNHRVRKIDINTGIITTVVGNGAWGYTGDGGLATAATVRDPMGLAFDAAGNLYIADAGNHRIRKVTPAGVISTVAGTGTAGYSGDEGPAEYAGINYPRGLTLDPSGNLYIADCNNHRIRKVTPGGIITTVAGTGVSGYPTDGVAPTASTVPYPYDVLVDPEGNLLIAQNSYGSIRKVNFTTNTITSVGYASCAAGLAFDNGYLYVAESCGNRVSRYDSNYSQVSVAGGYYVSGFSGDGGPATSALLSQPTTVLFDGNHNMYIYDTGNRRIRFVSAATGNIGTFAGSGMIGDGGPATDASLADPMHAVADSAGNVYIADVNNRRVRKVDAATGIITTYAGNGSTTYSGDNMPATSAGITIGDIALDANDNLLIASGSRIRRVDAATGIITLIAGGSVNLAPMNDGGPALGAGFTASSIAVDRDNNIYIGDTANHRVRMIDAATQIISTVAGSGTTEYFGEDVPALEGSVLKPLAIAVDAQKNIYIGDMTGYRVRKVDRSTGLIRTIAGVGVSGYSGDGGPATSAALVPRGIAVDAQGNVYASSGGKFDSSASVRKITPAGIISTFAGGLVAGFSGDGGPAASALLSRPRAISVDRNGNIYISDTGNGRIRKVLAPQADVTAPAVGASPPGRIYSTPQMVTLFSNEPAFIYYTTDGSDPRTSLAALSLDTMGQVSIQSNTLLQFYAIDRSGNAGSLSTQSYEITYQQAADPSYMSSYTMTGVTDANRTETAYVSLTTGYAMKFDGYGDFAGDNTVTLDSWFHVKSGTYAGQHFGSGHYNFSGRQGTLHFTRVGKEYRMVLQGDIHGAIISEGGDLVRQTGAATLYITSINNVAAPAALQFYGRVINEGDGGVVNPAAQLDIIAKSYDCPLSGYANTTIRLDREQVSLIVNGVAGTFLIGNYSSAEGPGKYYFVGGDGGETGVFEGPVFGIGGFSEAGYGIEHFLATAPRINAGNAHAAAIKADGSLWGWGDNSYGQLGIGGTLLNAMPKMVLSGVREVAAGTKHSVAVDVNGTVFAWGSNATGALGSGDNTDQALPKAALSGKTIRSVAAGNGFSLALDQDGGVFAWGENSYGQLGYGLAAEQSTTPQPVVMPAGTHVSAISAGSSYALALNQDGEVWGWGNNGRGQLGSDQFAYASLPVRLPWLAMISAVAAGGEHGLALSYQDGTVWAWGSNSRGQLGNGNNFDSVTPVQVPGLSDVVAIAAGYDHSLALKRDGTVWAWGGNSHGQLGNDDPQKRDSWIPVQVANLSGLAQGGIVSISAGNAFSIAMKYDGTVLSWGQNNARQLAITHTPEIYYVGLARMNVTDTIPPTVTATPAGGSYGAPITVTLTSSENSNNTIFYTLDGSDPANSATRKVASGVSTVSIPISTSCTLRYYAVDGGSNPSQPSSQLYSFNLAPSISGLPTKVALSGTPYAFTPQGSVPSGAIAYTIVNKPVWASFNAGTGALTGTPTASQVGTYGGIVISAVANGLTAQLPEFSITVTAAALGSATTFVAINGGASSATGNSVALSLGCSLGDKCSQMQFSNDDLIWTAPEPFATTKSWMVPSEDGLKTVYVKFLDAAGNPSNTYFSGIILLGSTSDTGSYLFDGKWGNESNADGKFLLPGAVAWSKSDGAVYVADGQNCRIQKFDSQLNFVAKWGGCGPGDGQFLGLNGVATDSLGNVYVSDAKNRIQKFAADGSFITKWSGTGTAVSMVAIDQDDTVYTTGNGYVQVFDRNGQFIRQWSVYQAGSGLAVDASKNVYVRSSNSVWQYDNAGRFVLSWSIPYGYSAAGLGNPSGFAFNPYDSSMVVADAQAHLIRFYSPPDTESGDAPTQTATYGGYGPGAGQLNRPQYVAFDDQGNMFIADTGNQRVLKLAPPYNGTPISVGAADTTTGGFNIPVSVSVDPAGGSVFVADMQNDRVQQFTAAGTFVKQFGSTGTGSAELRVPLGAVPDGRGNLYILDGGNNRVQKVSVATGAVLASFGSELSSPRKLALDRSGNVYVAQYTQITKYDANGAFIATWNNYNAATNSSFRAGDIVVDSHGATDVICVMDFPSRRIVKYDTSGNYLGSVAEGMLSNMQSLGVDNGGYLYVFDSSVGAINKFDPQGNLVTVWGKKAAVLNGSMRNALGLAVDSYGTVFVADSYNNRVQRFIPAAIPNGSATINSGSSTTMSRVVDLTIAAQSNVGVLQSMRFSNDNIAWSAWEPYAATKNGWQLPDREGTNYVYIQLRNSYGTISKTIKCSIMLKYELFTVVTAPVDSYTPVSVTPTADASMQVTFQSVISATGNSGVQVTAALTPPAPPQDLKVYNSQVYEIQIPGITFGGSAQVCLAFRPSAVSNPDNMKILHYAEGAWQDITTSRTYDLDNDTGRVCGHTDSFSPFMTGETVTATDGVCGASGGGTFASIPLDFLCAPGSTPSAVSGTGPWNWSCAGTNGGNPASCSALKLAYLEPPVTTASPAAGSYSGNGLQVTLATTNNAVIYYTTDGSTPTASSAVYGAPVSLPGNVTLKYFARDASNNTEQVKSSAYSITSATQPSGSFAGTKSGSTFSILRSEGGKAFSTVVASTTGTSYTDASALKPNTTYQYAVTSDADPTRTLFMSTRTPLYNGWNIVAVPYSVSGVAPATFFASPVGPVYQWVPSGTTTEGSNTPKGSYVTVTGLASGLGYFVKTTNASTMISYEGTPAPAGTTVVLKPGWTMISNPTGTVKSNIATNWLIDGEQLADAVTASTIGGGIYWWNGTTYDSWSIINNDPHIEPWKGYWLINLDVNDHTLTIQ